MGTETTKRVNCEGEEEDALAVELGEVDVCNNFALVSQFSLGSLQTSAMHALLAQKRRTS